MTTPAPKRIDHQTYLELLGKQAHRSPEGLRLFVLGDRGAPVELDLVIGNPSGACTVPPHEQSPIWNTFVASRLTDATVPDNGDHLGAFDCVLWPDLATWSQWCERWPALPQRAWSAIKSKVGVDYNVPNGPDEHEKLPDEVTAAMALHPHALVRRYAPTANHKRHPFLFVIDPPQSVAWRFFRDVMKKKPAECWTEALAFARAHARFVFDELERKVVTPDEVFRRWPGVALLETMAIHALAGASARFELGELFAGISAPA